jgi:hypothetical protein
VHAGTLVFAGEVMGLFVNHYGVALDIRFDP